MKSSTRNLFIALGLAAASLAASAQEFRIGFVNTDRIFREANAAKAAQTKLEVEFAKREKEIADFGNTLKTATEKFEREAPTLAESQRKFYSLFQSSPDAIFISRLTDGVVLEGNASFRALVDGQEQREGDKG